MSGALSQTANAHRVAVNIISGLQPPNGSRLSCGRNAHRRKAAERQTQRLVGEATQFFPIESARQLQAHVRRRPSELPTHLCYNSQALWLGQLWKPGQRGGAFPASTGLRSNFPLPSTKNTQSEAS